MDFVFLWLFLRSLRMRICTRVSRSLLIVDNDWRDFEVLFVALRFWISWIDTEYWSTEYWSFNFLIFFGMSRHFLQPTSKDYICYLVRTAVQFLHMMDLALDIRRWSLREQRVLWGKLLEGCHSAPKDLVLGVRLLWYRSKSCSTTEFLRRKDRNTDSCTFWHATCLGIYTGSNSVLKVGRGRTDDEMS